jgi:hypothetical protein
MISFGRPALKTYSHLDMKKLLENPSGLNLKHGLSGPSLIRDHQLCNWYIAYHSVYSEMIIKVVATYIEITERLVWLTRNYNYSTAAVFAMGLWSSAG